MDYKYDAGDVVSFNDPRSLETNFMVVQRMPGEYNASEPRYKVKSSNEGFERVVAESALTSRFVDSHAWKLVPKIKSGLPQKTRNSRQR
jgi:hypothetical protein